MKKIKVSTVREMANTQVIRLNSSFITKSVKALLAMRNVHKDLTINPEVDEDGEETGKISYEYSTLTPELTQSLCEQVIPFLEELVAALDDDDEPTPEA